jgi:acyl carrier protein phosphodiesterase
MLVGKQMYDKKPAPLPPAIPLYEIESKCRDQIRKEAAEAGVAFYELNQKTGQIEFHYVDINRVIQQVAQQMQQRMNQVSPLQ